MSYTKSLETLALEALAKKEYTGQKPGLQRIRKTLAALGNPQDNFQAIHIAGTNGKGSTSAMLNSILVAAGLRVGFYTSPHFLDCRERIRINNTLITKKDLENTLKIIFATANAEQLTYFEILTVAAFQYFAEQKIDILICEVGLGGTFDATNSIKNKLLNVITSIDLDHMEFLGNNISKIAAEKAGIIESKVPTVVFTGHKDADEVIKNRCQEKNSPHYFSRRAFVARDLGIDWKNRKQLLDYRGIYSNHKNIKLNILGKHQISNASLALACSEILQKNYLYKISNQAIYDGLKNVSWPGRFEIRKLSSPPATIILDGAHNAAGAKTLQKLLLSSPYPKKKLTLVINILQGKEYKKICKILRTVVDSVIILKLNSERALPQEILRHELAKYFPESKIWSIANFAELFKAEKLKPLVKNRVICVAGSLYAVGEAVRYFKKFSAI